MMETLMNLQFPLRRELMTTVRLVTGGVCSLAGLDVDGVGEELVDKMIEAGLLRDVADFYSLTVDQVAALDTGRTYLKDGMFIQELHIPAA